MTAVASRFQYSRWDGSQVGFDLDADALLEEMTDDLLYHGDLNAALRRMMQQGFQDREGRDVSGMREMLEKLRERRREQLDRYDLGGVYEDIANQLDEIVDQEREGIDRRVDEARSSGDKRREELLEDLAQQRRQELEQLPPDLAGRVSELQQYDWMDDAARQRFEELMEELKKQLLDSMFNQLQQGMSEMSPEQLARMKDMLAELNQMLEQRERGEEPDFDGFMERFGDFFPGNPQTLDELLEQMAQSMAQMQQLLNSMSPEQRAQLQELSNALLDDMDLRWQMDQLGQNLRNAFPQMGWGQGMGFRGDEPLPLQGMGTLLDQLGDIDALENLMRNATNPGQLAEVDLDRVRDLLGDDAARSLQQLSELARMLEEAGLIEQREGRMELTPKGIRRIGQRALGDLFRKLLQDRPGRHEIEAHRVRPRALQRSQAVRVRRSAAPRRRPHDQERDHPRRRRHAGPHHARRLRDRAHRAGHAQRDGVDARRVALDGDARPLPRGQEGRDGVARVDHARSSRATTSAWSSFGRVAREVKPERLPEATWDFEWGTNMQHALALARKLLLDADRQEADHHDHRRRADRPHRRRLSLLRLPAVAAHDRDDVARGAALHQGRHPDQHVHARGESLPP